jgi:hypothetical protein
VATLYLGDDLISPCSGDVRFSRLSKQAQEAAYFEQFKPANLFEIRPIPMLSALAGVLIGFLTLGSFFSNDAAQSRPSASPREAAHPPSPRPPGVGQHFRAESEIRPPSKRHENL